MTPLHTRQEVIAWLTTLTPEERVTTWSVLTDSQTTTQAASIIETTIYMATREQGRPSYSEVAERFGITVKQVTRAVSRHNTRKAARAAATNGEHGQGVRSS